MTDRGWQATDIGEIPRAGKSWIPIRKHFGIGAFGVNAWVAEAEGDEIVSEHVEESSGHEELYLVTAGHAAFTVGGDEVDAPAGTFVFVEDPEAKRRAIAKEAGTTILTIGAKAGEAFEISSWEASAEMFPLYEAGDYQGAAAVLRRALEDAEDAGLYYNLACMEALTGQKDDALDHLRIALEAQPGYRDTAAGDPDLESIRDDPRFASALGTL